MKTRSDIFREWLFKEIHDVLIRKVEVPPLFLWCDPDREWQELLKRTSQSEEFELWAEEEPELVIRDRFYRQERKPRVVWVPTARENLSWLKVFELEAEEVWEKGLVQALREYGVHIPGEHEADLKALLPAHAKEWFDQPKATWKELTPGNAKGTLVTDHRMLEALAGETGEFDRLSEEKLFGIFARRAREDFGFPDPEGKNERVWRIEATACLLCTDAAAECPQDPPREGELVISPGLARDRALRLLRDWQSNVQYMPQFEHLSQEADRRASLTHWARNLSEHPRSLSSRAVETALFQQEVQSLDSIEEVEELAKALEGSLQRYQERLEGYWEKYAREKVGWTHLIQLAKAASLLVENGDVEDQWRTPAEAIDWYVDRGWHFDQAGESLFQEVSQLPDILQRIRARLRRGYLRALDRAGSAFSQLLEQNASEVFSLPTSGEAVLKELQKEPATTAIVYLDACRLELGNRLAEMLNAGEPMKRAATMPAVAPVPSVTELGMAFALPAKRADFTVTVSEKGKFEVHIRDFDGDLTVAEQRRKWLKSSLAARDCLTIAEVLDSDKLKPAGRVKKPLAVYGKEFDDEGHDGRLELTGSEDHLERYAQAIRNLREAGYHRIIVTTDHGFFHWHPDADERDDEKPEGEILWQSRRAIVGRSLKHKTAIGLKVLQSDLEVRTPRSVNTFKVYGGLGYFHGGATLQEIIIHAGFLADREHGVRGSEVSREHLVRAAQDTLTRENVLEMEFLQLVALSLASRNSLLPWNDISGLRPGAEIPDWLLSLGVVEKSGRLKEPRLYEVLNQMRHRHLAQRMAA